MPLSNSTVTIVDSSGNSTVILVASAVPTGGVMVMGSDGTLSRFISTDTSGRTVVVGAGTAGAAAGGVVTVQGSASGTPIPVSGTFTSGGTADVTATGALGALNAAVQVITAGLETVGFQLAAGTLVGTIVPEVSFDGGTTWVSTYFDTASGGKVASIALTNPSPATAATIVGVGGSGISRVRVSAYTSGTANVTVRATTRGDPSVLFAGPIAGTPPLHAAYIGGTDGTNLVGFKVKPAATAAVAADPALVVALSPNSPVACDQLGGFVPSPLSETVIGPAPLTVDIDGSLVARAVVMTDEESYRDDFPGSTLSTLTLTGTVTFTNGSLTVTGVGTQFTKEVTDENYIRRSADTDASYTQIASVDSDTQITLTLVYPGTSGSGTAFRSFWDPTVSGGATITVSGGYAVLATGTTSGASATLDRIGDYPPMSLYWGGKISQRIANQAAIVGFADVPAAPTKQTVLVLDGTTNTTVKFRTSSGAAGTEIQETTVTLPNGATTAADFDVQIDLEVGQAVLAINGVVLARHRKHLPGPYDALHLVSSITNTAAAASTTSLSIDYVYFLNTDQVEVRDSFNTPSSMQPTLADLSGNPINQIGDYAGRAQVGDNSRATYSASIVGLVAANTATDVFTIYGSATKTVRITKLVLSGQQTTGGIVTVQVIKRSAANTAGTSSSPAGTPHDSADAAATATVRAYTVNPTGLGAAVGSPLRAEKIFVPATTSLFAQNLVIDFAARNVKPWTLRGTSEGVCLNLNGTTWTGNTLNCYVEWVEE